LGCARRVRGWGARVQVVASAGGAGKSRSSSPMESVAPPKHKVAMESAISPQRALAALVLGGQCIVRCFKPHKVHWRNTFEQLQLVGPASVGVALLSSGFVGMVFTIQFVREFVRLGLTRSVGGVLALALMRELSPVVTAIILAGRVGSAFAAELGTMRVTEQIEALHLLGTDPVDYLVVPRVLACVIALPVLTTLCFTIGIAASVLIADGVYDISANVILDGVQKALGGFDVISMNIKGAFFGAIIAIVSCAWGLTTRGGAKGVGLSTTASVVTSLVSILIADFILSWIMFQGLGDSLGRLV